MLTLTGRVDFRKVPSGHALEKPFFRQQCLPGLMIVVQAGGQGFQQPGLLLRVTYPVEQRLLALAQMAFYLPAFKELPRPKCGR